MATARRLTLRWAFRSWKWFDKLKDASEEEEDMLDLAFGLTHTSRLGCQIKMTEELDGLVVSVPGGTRNMLLE